MMFIDPYGIDVDARTYWALGHNAFQYWFFASALLIKFALLLRQTPSLGRAISLALAMSFGGLTCIAIFPIGLVVSIILSEFIIQPALGIYHVGAFAWICPIAVSVLVAAFADAVVLALSLKWKITARRFAMILLTNTICIALAINRMYAYTLAHPPEAEHRYLHHQSTRTFLLDCART